MSRVGTGRSGALVATGDVVALCLFAVIGLVSHHKPIALHGLVRDALPVVAGWLIAAVAFGAYRRPSRARFLAAWMIGVGGGAFVRGAVLHRHVLGARYLTFVGVTLAVTLALLLAWRAILRTVSARLARPVRF
jgi:hypothetical protein